jgi:hypothetical protein
MMGLGVQFYSASKAMPEASYTLAKGAQLSPSSVAEECTTCVFTLEAMPKLQLPQVTDKALFSESEGNG